MEHRQIYDTKQWKEVRAEFKKYKKGLCERCLAKGLIKSGEMVHHKVYISDENQYDPTIALNFDNLELLCRDCHAEEHRKDKSRRYSVDKEGNVIIK